MLPDSYFQNLSLNSSRLADPFISLGKLLCNNNISLSRIYLVPCQGVILYSALTLEHWYHNLGLSRKPIKWKSSRYNQARTEYGNLENLEFGMRILHIVSLLVFISGLTSAKQRAESTLRNVKDIRLWRLSRESSLSLSFSPYSTFALVTIFSRNYLVHVCSTTYLKYETM